MSEEGIWSEELSLHFIEAFIPIWVKNAKNGCKDSARTLAYVISRNLSSRTLPETLMDYLLEPFQAIARVESADHALYLRYRPGKKNTSLYRRQAVAFVVRRLYWVGEAKTITKASEMVSERGVTVSTNPNVPFRVAPDTAYKYYFEIWPGPPERGPKALAKFSGEKAPV